MKKFTFLLCIATLLAACREEITCRALNNNDFQNFFGSFEDYPDIISFYTLSGDTNSYALEVEYSDAYTCTRSNVKDCECDVSKRLSSPTLEVGRFSLRINTERSFNKVGPTAFAQIIVGHSYSSFYVNEAEEDIENRIINAYGSNANKLHYTADTVIQNRTYGLVLVESPDPVNGNFILDREEGVVAYTDTAGVSWYRAF